MNDDDKLTEFVRCMAAAASYYSRRTGVMGGEGLVEHLREAAFQFLRGVDGTEGSK